jgi:hypothetical protein
VKEWRKSPQVRPWVSAGSACFSATQRRSCACLPLLITSGVSVLGTGQQHKQNDKIVNSTEASSLARSSRQSTIHTTRMTKLTRCDAVVTFVVAPASPVDSSCPKFSIFILSSVNTAEWLARCHHLFALSLLPDASRTFMLSPTLP